MNADFQLLIDGALSETAQVGKFVEFAIEVELEAQNLDEQQLGRKVTYQTFVDGALADAHNVRTLSSTISFEFAISEDVLSFISEELKKMSPVGSGADKHPGQYKASHVIFADGILVDDTESLPQAREYIFVSTLPYARKIEGGEGHRPQSEQAPQGVYEVTSFQARNRFGNSAKIVFEDYVGTFGVMAESSNATYGKHTTLQHNKSVNRFPSIRVNL